MKFARIARLSLFLIPTLLLSFPGCESGESERQKRIEKLEKQSAVMLGILRGRKLPSLQDYYSEEKNITPEMISEYKQEMNKRWERIDDEDPVNRLPFVVSSIFTNQVDRYEPDDSIDRKLVIRWAKIIEEIIWVRGGGPIEPIAGKDDDFFLAPRTDKALARIQRLRERLEAEEEASQ